MIHDVINAQNNSDIKKDLQKFQKKETQLKTENIVTVL